MELEALKKAMNKILITGATGFIGKRLIMALLEDGHEVYALVRIRGKSIFPVDYPNLKLLFGDLQNKDVLKDLPADIDVAYYLMHSMSDIMSNLEAVESQVAENFVEGIKKTNVKQIVYLSGITHAVKLSKHLKSRLMVENILKQSNIPLTILRASIIVGAGSASFEIIRDLVEKLPVMVAPKWINRKCQPIAVRDVIYYLKGVILHPECLNDTFDIGGPDVLTFRQVLLQFAGVRHLKRYIFSVPVLTPKLSSYWLVFVTSVKFSLAAYLVESMIMDSNCEDTRILKIFDHQCLNYRESIELAFYNIDQNEVTSTWMDSWEIHATNPDVQEYIEVPKFGCLSDCQIVKFKGSELDVLHNIWSIGGQKGWYGMGYLWKLRGLIDKMVGGVGLNRGRRDPHEIQVGDSIDFWRVIKADKENMHLILLAEMKIPGEAWLEFQIIPGNEGPELVQKATFRPRGLLGRLYWYSLMPFHYFIFGRMAKKIAEAKDTSDT